MSIEGHNYSGGTGDALGGQGEWISVVDDLCIDVRRTVLQGDPPDDAFTRRLWCCFVGTNFVGLVGDANTFNPHVSVSIFSFRRASHYDILLDVGAERVRMLFHRADTCRCGNGIGDNRWANPSDIKTPSGSDDDADVVLWKLRHSARSDEIVLDVFSTAGLVLSVF